MIFYLKKTFQSLYLLVIFLLIATLIGSFFIFEFKKFEKETSFAQISIISFKKQPKTITLIFVGDIMLDRGVKYMIENYGGGDYKFPFLKIADCLREADILFGNLEGPISDKGVKVGSIYSFRSDPKAIDGLIFAGFDILSVANNHIFDYGRIAMEDTFLRLKETGIDFVGGGFSEEEAYSPVIKEINGSAGASTERFDSPERLTAEGLSRMSSPQAKIAFLAYTNLGTKYWAAKGEGSGIDWLEEEKLKENIREAKKLADLVIVSMHFGEEYFSKPTKFQISISKAAIDSGADLVIGHHPHVIQEIEKYGKGYIAYSLGNFVFDQEFSKETMKGLILKVLVENSKIKEVIPVEIKINNFFQPETVGD